MNEVWRVQYTIAYTGSDGKEHELRTETVFADLRKAGNALRVIGADAPNSVSTMTCGKVPNWLYNTIAGN